MYIKDFDKYIVKSSRTEYDLAKYVRKRLELSIKDDVKPFWRNLDPIFSTREQAAYKLKDYILKCYINNLSTVDYRLAVVNFLGCDFNHDFNLDFCGGIDSYGCDFSIDFAESFCTE